MGFFCQSQYLPSFSFKSETFNQEPALNKSLLEWFERSHELGGHSDPKLGKSLHGVEERKYCDGTYQMWKGKGMGTILDLLMVSYSSTTWYSHLSPTKRQRS